ncbi:DUF115 domain-containing protein [Halobacillus litoralis]|uniref:motility associated factor glycosyltransferase family protein n=1 Tax=Halobacillus litoralis TaxID=45668 RepID=UPI001CD717B4|nr:6-hydroxymethylpterin diphosphokinase MptE-like protein [Halobacillus litoralis]MCA0971573.1 DUF115 domain-containing protein [Halobacillus litoralis]
MNNVIYIENSDKNVPVYPVIFKKTKVDTLLTSLNGLNLNSTYAPDKESNRFVENHYKRNYAHILFGIGHSHIAKDFVYQMVENDLLIIIEPNVDLFEGLRDRGHLDELLNLKNVFILVGFEFVEIDREIKYVIENGYLGFTEFIISPNYEKIYPQYIKTIREIIKQSTSLSTMNIATMTVFSQIWQKNLLYNLKDIWKSESFVEYEGKLDCPVIIASSGPSLTKQLDILREVRESNCALIIAAGSTINPLLKAGIKPHIIVSVDGGEANWNHFKSIDYDDIPLFYSLAVHKNIPASHGGLKVAFNPQEDMLTSWVEDIASRKVGTVDGGASVANFSLDVAYKISSGPITLIGQDLAYTGDQTHAKGNRNYKKVIELENSRKYTSVEGYYGGQVRSDYQFLSMKKVFENMIKSFRIKGDNRSVYNSTEGGAAIDGFEKVPFKHFVGEFSHLSYEQEFNKLFQKLEGTIESNKDVIEKNVSNEKMKLHEAKSLCENAIEILNKTDKYKLIEQTKLDELDEIDSKVNVYTESKILHFITMPVNFRINYKYRQIKEESEAQQLERILNKSEALYKGIYDAINTTVEFIDEVFPEGVEKCERNSN